MVEYGLPKPGVRVRFPLPAPAQEQRLFCSYFSSILRWKKNICITPCSFASDKKLVSLPLFIGDARFTRADRCKGNFALLFYTKSFAVSLALSLFREKSLSIRLLVCKRACDGSDSLPTFHDDSLRSQGVGKGNFVRKKELALISNYFSALY